MCKGYQQLILEGKEEPTLMVGGHISFNTVSHFKLRKRAMFDCNVVFYLMGTKLFLHADQLLHFNEFHKSENQKDISIFQMTTKNSIFQSTTNRPVLTNSGVLTGVVISS